jgi:hypothetical protein
MAEISLNNDFDLSGIDWEDLVLKPTPVATEKPKDEPQLKETETL